MDGILSEHRPWGPQEAESSSVFQRDRKQPPAWTRPDRQTSAVLPGYFWAVLISVHWEKKSQVLSSIRKIIAFTNQHESGPLNPGLKWVANMAWPWLMRRFFNLTRCFRSLLQCRFGFGFPVDGIWSQEFCLPRAHTWCAPIVSLMPEPVSFFFLKVYLRMKGRLRIVCSLLWALNFQGV